MQSAAKQTLVEQLLRQSAEFHAAHRLERGGRSRALLQHSSGAPVDKLERDLRESEKATDSSASSTGSSRSESPEQPQPPPPPKSTLEQSTSFADNRTQMQPHQELEQLKKNQRQQQQDANEYLKQKQRQTQPQQHPQTQPQTQPQQHPQTQPQTQPQQQPQTQPQTQPQQHPQTQPQTQPQQQPQAQPQTQPQQQPQAQPQTQPQQHPQTQPQTQPQQHLQTQPQTQPQQHPQTQPQTQPQQQPQTQPQHQQPQEPTVNITIQDALKEIQHLGDGESTELSDDEQEFEEGIAEALAVLRMEDNLILHGFGDSDDELGEGDETAAPGDPDEAQETARIEHPEGAIVTYKLRFVTACEGIEPATSAGETPKAGEGRRPRSIRVNLVGERSQSGEMRFECLQEVNWRMLGRADEFSASIPDLGRLLKLRVRIPEEDPSGGGAADGRDLEEALAASSVSWMLDRVEVRDTARGVTVSFRCGQRLAADFPGRTLRVDD